MEYIDRANSTSGGGGGGGMAYLDQPEDAAGRNLASGELAFEHVSARHTSGGRRRPVAWPLLADDFFRLAHNDMTGKPRLNPRDAGVGLAAALLGELTMARKIESRQGALIVCVDARMPPADALAHTVLDQIMRDPQQHDVRAWLVALGMGAREQVAARLLRAGHVRRVVGKRRWRADEVRFVPVDCNRAAMPWARLSLRIRNLQTLDTEDVFLAGLVTATGLTGRVLDGAPSEASAYLSNVVGELPVPLWDLVTQAKVVVGESVLGHRR